MVVAVVVVVAIAGVIGFRAWLTQAPHRVTVGQAVDRYRSTASDQSSAPAVAGVPEPGVYVYATYGSETVDALGGDTHTYPSETTITVTSTPCGGFQMAWRPVTGRADTTDVCRSNGGLLMTTVVNAHEFFHISQAETFTCDSDSWWLPPPGITRWSSVCRSDGGRTTERAGRVVGTDLVVVGTETRTAVHVRWDDVVSGSSIGTSANDLWLDPSTGLPLHETSTASTGNDTVIGHVTFSELVDLVLTTSTPRR